MNGELKWMWKEASVACFTYYTGIAWGMMKMTKTVNDDSSERGTFVAQVRSFAT